MRPAIISGFSAVAFAIGGWAVPLVFPQVDPQIAKWMLGFAVTLLLIALLLWFRGLKQPEQKEQYGLNQITDGNQSPAIGSIGGDAHLYFGGQPEPNLPSGSRGGTDESLAGLERAMSGVNKLEQSRRASCPIFPMWEAVMHVASVVKDVDETACYPIARREIRQAARDGRIEIWGRPTIPLTRLAQLPQPKEIWEPIGSEYWSDFKLNSMAVGEIWQEHPHTEAEAHVTKGRDGGMYWTLRVDQRDIERTWRKPRNDGGGNNASFGPSGPNAWMADD